MVEQWQHSVDGRLGCVRRHGIFPGSNSLGDLLQPDNSCVGVCHLSSQESWTGDQESAAHAIFARDRCGHKRDRLHRLAHRPVSRYAVMLRVGLSRQRSIISEDPTHCLFRRTAALQLQRPTGAALGKSRCNRAFMALAALEFIELNVHRGQQVLDNGTH